MDDQFEIVISRLAKLVECDPAIVQIGAVRLMIASIRLMGQSKFMRSIVDATQPEQRHGLA
jgi:hypothetical protein